MLQISDSVGRVITPISDQTDSQAGAHTPGQLSAHILCSGLTILLSGHTGPVEGSSDQFASIQEAISKLVTDQSAQTIVLPARLHQQRLRIAGQHNQVLEVSPCKARVGLQSQGTDSSCQRSRG